MDRPNVFKIYSTQPFLLHLKTSPKRIFNSILFPSWIEIFIIFKCIIARKLVQVFSTWDWIKISLIETSLSKHQRIKKLFVGLRGLVWLCEETLEQLDEVLVATVGPVEVGELVNELGEFEASDRWELRSWCWIWWCSPDLAADRAAAAAAMDWCCNRYEAGNKNYSHQTVIFH